MIPRTTKPHHISPHHTFFASHRRSNITSHHITHDTFILSPHHTSRSTSRKKRTQRRSLCVEFLGRMGRTRASSPHHTSHIIASHQPSDITSHHITHHKPKEENTKKKFLGRVLGPDRRNLTTSHITHITSRHITHDTVILSPHHTSRITSRKKRTQRRSSWPERLGRMSRIDAISPHHTSHIIASHQPSDITSHHITHHKPKEENTKKKFLGRVLGPVTTSHITSRKKRTQRRSSWAEFLGRIDEISPHHTSHIIASHQTSDITSHHITHHKPKEENPKKKFLGRVLGPDGSPHISSHHITHHTFISHHIKHHKEEVLRVFS